jgi:hypothetical protein
VAKKADNELNLCFVIDFRRLISPFICAPLVQDYTSVGRMSNSSLAGPGLHLNLLLWNSGVFAVGFSAAMMGTVYQMYHLVKVSGQQ